MASSPVRLCYLLLLVLLLATLTSPSVHASPERRRRGRVEAPALPPAVAPGRRAREELHVAPTSRGGGTGAWTFSAMLPRGFVPPSGSSACHNDMPDDDTAADTAHFFACSGAGTP